MVYVMHVAAAKVIEASTTFAKRADVLQAIAAGEHLTTLAFSEQGSRSQFWAPVSTLEPHGQGYQTNAAKSWVTAAHHADSYVASAQAPTAQSPVLRNYWMSIPYVGWRAGNTHGAGGETVLDDGLPSRDNSWAQ
jgi:isovaleryl-CoA dehydrogenase